MRKPDEESQMRKKARSSASETQTPLTRIGESPDPRP